MCVPEHQRFVLTNGHVIFVGFFVDGYMGNMMQNYNISLSLTKLLYFWKDSPDFQTLKLMCGLLVRSGDHPETPTASVGRWYIYPLHPCMVDLPAFIIKINRM